MICKSLSNGKKNLHEWPYTRGALIIAYNYGINKSLVFSNMSISQLSHVKSTEFSQVSGMHSLKCRVSEKVKSVQRN